MNSTSQLVSGPPRSPCIVAGGPQDPLRLWPSLYRGLGVFATGVMFGPCLDPKDTQNICWDGIIMWDNVTYMIMLRWCMLIMLRYQFLRSLSFFSKSLNMTCYGYWISSDVMAMDSKPWTPKIGWLRTLAELARNGDETLNGDVSF